MVQWLATLFIIGPRVDLGLQRLGPPALKKGFDYMAYQHHDPGIIGRSIGSIFMVKGDWQ